MKMPTVVFRFVLVFWLCASSAQALIVPFGQREIEEAGVGCVGGLNSDHGNTAYFRGDTERLNEQLGLLDKDVPKLKSIKVVLHAGATTVDPAEETLQTGFHDRVRDQRVPIDWSVLKACPFDKVAAGICNCDEKSVIIDVWIGSAICLEDLKVPSAFTVQSAGEIEDFAKRHDDAR